MQSIKRYIFMAAWCVTMMALPLCGWAQVSDDGRDSLHYEDGLRFSLLTCTPGTDAYAHFGHTAILAVDEIAEKNAVFNYGCFDASQEHFVLNFIKGDTNYQLDAETLKFFLWRYSETGNGVTEQVLNLTAEEKERLMKLLLENVRPENQTYLYNWLYDNCTERARDIIEQAVDGKVVYERRERTVTVREMLHEKMENSPWLRLGIDLLLGQEIDQPAPRRTQMFIPNYFQAEIDSAYIVGIDGTRRPLVKETNQLLEDKNQETASPLSPLVVFSLLLAVTVCISVIDWRRRKLLVGYDVVLHCAQGVAGIIIAYLFCCSKHPAVDSNWQVVLFNPLALCYAVWLVFCKVKKRKNRLAAVNLAVCGVFVVLMLTVKQVFNPAVYLMALILMIRGVVSVRVYSL